MRACNPFYLGARDRLFGHSCTRAAFLRSISPESFPLYLKGHASQTTRTDLQADHLREGDLYNGEVVLKVTRTLDGLLGIQTKTTQYAVPGDLCIKPQTAH